MRTRKIHDYYGNVEGEVHGETFIRHVNEEDDLYLKGVCLMDKLLDRLVDENIESIVLVYKDKRYMSTVEDWQEYGRPGPVYASIPDSEYSTYLPWSYMKEK